MIITRTKVISAHEKNLHTLTVLCYHSSCPKETLVIQKKKKKVSTTKVFRKNINCLYFVLLPLSIYLLLAIFFLEEDICATITRVRVLKPFFLSLKIAIHTLPTVKESN